MAHQSPTEGAHCARPLDCEAGRGRFALSLLLTIVLALTATVVGQLAGPVSVAHAGALQTVVDSDSDPYSGIYLRDGTTMGNVPRVTSRYMLYGTQVELLCGTWGEAVGPNVNGRWHQVRVAGESGGASVGTVGFIVDRYLDTPNTANQVTPGEPECDSFNLAVDVNNGGLAFPCDGTYITTISISDGGDAIHVVQTYRGALHGIRDPTSFANKVEECYKQIPGRAISSLLPWYDQMRCEALIHNFAYAVGGNIVSAAIPGDFETNASPIDMQVSKWEDGTGRLWDGCGWQRYLPNLKIVA